ncbi:MAG TPA: sigma-70 family RNA polymerase sigma factor [Acidimicrobiales bacterium]
MRFADWYRDAHPGLLEAVLRAVGRHALAEDAVEDAFEKAFARWDDVQAMRSPRGWVYRVAVNEARRQLRREVRDLERATVAFAGRPDAVAPPAGEAWLAVRELPIRQRTAVVLRHVAGMTEAEVAQAMGVTRSTVSSALAAAYRKLGDELADERHEERPMETAEQPAETLTFAVAKACDPTGCDVEAVADGSTLRARYSDAVQDTIKVRPGDLVALDLSGDAPTVVWRWWHGTVVSIAAAAGAEPSIASVERNVTQRSAGDPRTAAMDVVVPPELAPDVAPGDVVYFGVVDDRKVVIASAAHPDLGALSASFGTERAQKRSGSR